MVVFFTSEDEAHGEPHVEWKGLIDLCHVGLRKLDTQGFDIGFEVLDLTLANNGKDIGCLIHDVGEGLLIFALEVMCGRGDRAVGCQNVPHHAR